MKLVEKVAVITGAASGMGKAIATLFAEEGARVVVADIDNSGGKQTVDEINSTSDRAVFVHTDVSKPSDVKNLVDAAIEKYSKIDILVNNAGIFMKMTPIEEIDEAVWDRIYSVNVKGIFNGAKYVVPVMKNAGSGVIINTASMTGHRPGSMQSAYASSKGAVINLTKALANELAPHKIRVNCICPSLTETPMLFNSELWEHVSDAPHPFGRLVSPEDIASAALYLASDDAAMVTGLCLDVNGGQGV
ncbi:MAG: SDR family oxidoreductase [Dehalococcoidales bacterium]|nr:MAG: SDR family oxidoreductase [Dehalococcoidales bacterium]